MSNTTKLAKTGALLSDEQSREILREKQDLVELKHPTNNSKSSCNTSREDSVLA